MAEIHQFLMIFQRMHHCGYGGWWDGGGDGKDQGEMVGVGGMGWRWLGWVVETAKTKKQDNKNGRV